MKKKYIAIFIICFLIGADIVIQAHTINGKKLYASSNTITEIKAEIEGEEELLEKIEANILNAERRIKKYESSDSETDEQFIKNLEQQLKQNRTMAGAVAVRGKGVKIVIDDGTRKLKDGEGIGDILVHDQDLLRVINELRVSGAEAVSLNGQRVTAVTAVTCAGYTMRVNGKPIARPFEIKAIGNSSDMVKKLQDVGGYGYILKSCGIKFNMKTIDSLKIERSGNTGEINYMERSE